MRKAYLILVIIISVFTLSACFINKSESSTTKYNHFYDSQGQYIAYMENNFLYEAVSRKNMGGYHPKYNIFTDMDGNYLGELYKNFYLLYNKNSEHINKTYSVNSIAPISSIQPIQPVKAIISLPLDYIDIYESSPNGKIKINKNNYNSYIDINPSINGSVAMYVYLKVSVTPKNPFTLDNSTLKIFFNINVKYRGINKEDSSTSKIFTYSENTYVYALPELDYKIITINDIFHKNYSNYNLEDAEITVTSITGEL